MKGFIAWTLAALAATPSALELVRRDNPAVVQADIVRRQPTLPPNVRDRLRKRQNTVQSTLDNEGTLYFINATIGTPVQSFQLHIDTGSSDLWVNSANSRLCRDPRQYCSVSGTYSANRSSTYHYLNSAFNISYEDGSGAVGDYVTDTLNIAQTSLQNFQFGVGYRSSSAQGILGIGYEINEVQNNRAQLGTYPNLPQALVDARKTSADAYSLWLNDLEANTGSILFGGVDTDKFMGSLATVPVIPVFGAYAEFVIALTALGQNGNAGSVGNNLRIPVLLDSGSSLTYLPDDIASNVFDAFNVDYSQSQGQGTVDCNVANQQGSIDFTFSGQTISVGFNELVISTGPGSPCIFGIAAAGDSTPVLGDTFLRSAYVVYDLDNNEISIAPTTFNATGSNVMEIQKGSSGVPQATPVASPVTSVPNFATGAGRIGPGTTVVNGQTLTGSGNAAARTPPPSRKAYGAAAAAGLGAAILAL